MHKIKRLLAFVLTFAMVAAMLPMRQEAKAAELSHDAYAVADSLFDQIDEMELRATKDANQTQLTDAAMQIVMASDSYVEGSLERTGASFTWWTEDGIHCVYSPRMRKIQEEMTPAAGGEQNVIVNEPKATKGGSASSNEVYLVGPYYGHDEDFTDQYKKEATRIATVIGDTDGYTTYSGTAATVDKVAEAVANGAVVIFDSHGITDYENPDDEYDFVTGATSSYMCLTSTTGLTDADYEDGALYYSDGICINGATIANHMTKNSPSGILWMAICLGMATDTMCEPLREKGVEVVYGYSQSVTFAGDYLYEETFWEEMMTGHTVAESVATMKENWGNWDWSEQIATYYGWDDGYTTIGDARNDYSAFPVVVSSEDTHPGQRNDNGFYGACSLQTVNSTYKLNVVADIPEEQSLSDLPAYNGELKTGDQVVIYAPAYGKALSTEKVATHYNKGVDLSVINNVLFGYGNSETWTVTVNTDGTVSFANGGQNIAMADQYSSMNLGEKHDKWELISLGDGLFNIKNVGRNSYMEWYASMDNWSAYTSAIGDQFELSIYIIGKGVLTPGAVTPEDPDTPDTPAVNLPDQDGAVVSVADAIAAGQAMTHDTYTTLKYKVTGEITEVYNTQYGNMRIKDANGNILTIYGTYDATGENRYDAMEVKPVAGDIVTIYGVIGQYNGAAQIKNGWIVEHIPAGSIPEQPENPEAPQLPTEDGAVVSVADAIAAGQAMTHDTYTTLKYKVTGEITEVYNTQYGNMRIKDANGNILTIYGTYDATGENRYDAMEVKPVAGDTVTIYGVIGQYNGDAQIKNGWIVDHIPGADTPEQPDTPAVNLPDQDGAVVSIADAIAAGQAMDHNTYTELKYKVTGEITEVYNAQYGNMRIKDADGNILTIYGTYDATGENRYDAMEVKPVAGDTVTIYGVIGQYNGDAQIKNGWIVEHIPAGSTPEQPETPEEPEQTVSYVDTPVAGTAYKFVMNQAGLGRQLGFTGQMSNTYYFGTSEDVAEMVDVYLEEAAGGYHIYFMNGSTKTYLNVIPRSNDATKTNVVMQTLAENGTPSVYELNTEFKYVKTSCAGTEWYLGTYGSNTTISASKTSYIEDTSTIGVSQFVTWFATADVTETPEDVPGDLTGEGTVDSADGLLLLQYLNGWNVENVSAEAMDINGDGKVDSLDGLLLMRYLNGWDITLG